MKEYDKVFKLTETEAPNNKRTSKDGKEKIKKLLTKQQRCDNL